jgi:hypothetical protein
LTALTGGAAAPLMAAAMKAIGSEILKMAIGMIGQQIGAAFSDIGRVQSSINDRLGTSDRSIRDIIDDVGQQLGASPSEIGQAQFQADFAMKQMTDSLKHTFAQGDLSKKAKANGPRSWLQVMADGMTKILDASLAKLDNRSTALADIQRHGGTLKSTDRRGIADNQAMTTKAQQDFSVAQQEFTILMQSVNTAIKSIGEALAAMARKQ